MIEFNEYASPRAERKLLLTAVNVGTKTAPVWERVGHGIEDSSIEYNVDIAKITDILGNTNITVNKAEPVQSFDPVVLRGKSKLSAKILDIYSRNALTELETFEALLIYAFIGADGSYHAEKYENCAVVATRIGGSNDVSMTVEVHFSNDKTLGTVNDYKGEIVFTAAA